MARLPVANLGTISNAVAAIFYGITIQPAIASNIAGFYSGVTADGASGVVAVANLAEFRLGNAVAAHRRPAQARHIAIKLAGPRNVSFVVGPVVAKLGRILNDPVAANRDPDLRRKIVRSNALCPQKSRICDQSCR